MQKKPVSFDIRQAYQELQQQYKFTPDAFATALNIKPEDIAAGMESGAMDIDLLNMVSIIYAMTFGDTDSRLAASIEALGERFSVSQETIALLAKQEVSVVRQFIADPGSVPAEAKYQLAYTTMFLQFVLCKDRKRW